MRRRDFNLTLLAGVGSVFCTKVLAGQFFRRASDWPKEVLFSELPASKVPDSFRSAISIADILSISSAGYRFYGDDPEKPERMIGIPADESARSTVTSGIEGSIRGLLGAPSSIGLSSLLGTAQMKALLQSKKAKNSVAYVQRYLFPTRDKNGLIARMAATSMLSNRPITSSYKEPELYESETGTIIYINYVAELNQNKGRATRGRGEVRICIVPPEETEPIKSFLEKTPNAWTDQNARADLLNGLGGLAENSLKQFPFAFELDSL
jgi:hypothetical protein